MTPKIVCGRAFMEADSHLAPTWNYVVVTRRARMKMNWEVTHVTMTSAIQPDEALRRNPDRKKESNGQTAFAIKPLLVCHRVPGE